ncbi:MAG: hypothetical protein AB3N63_15690 [Puniceicoccaceae bacterium]
MKYPARYCLFFTITTLLLPLNICAAVVLDRLGDLPGATFNSIAEDVSGDGSIVVGRSAASRYGFTTLTEAFYWTPSGGMVPMGDLDFSDKVNSYANGIDEAGEIIVGGAERLLMSESMYSAFWWVSPGPMDVFGAPDPVEPSAANGISPDGICVAGHYMEPVDPLNPTPGDHVARVVMWEYETPIFPELTVMDTVYPYGMAYAISNSFGPDNSRTMVGMIAGEDRWSLPAYWTKVGNTLYPKIIFYSLGDAFGVSEDGQRIVGSYERFSNQLGFYVDVSDGALDVHYLDYPDYGAFMFSASARDITRDKMIIVGQSTTSNMEVSAEAVIWEWYLKDGETEPKYHARTLNEYAIAHGVSLDGFVMTDARAITPNGDYIVGVGMNSEYQMEAFRLSTHRAEGGGSNPLTYLGSEVDEHGIAQTSTLGLINVNNAPNIYAYDLGKYIWCAEETITEQGSWFFLYDREDSD